MPNPFLDNRAFTPRITSEVKRAYDDNLRQSPNDAGDVSIRGLGALIKGTTDIAKASGCGPGLTGFDTLQSLDFRQAFEARSIESSQLFERIGLTIPTAGDCLSYGANLPKLARIYDDMLFDGLEPEIVLSPALDLEDWQTLYQNLVYDPVVNHDDRIKDDGLNAYWFSDSEWKTLTAIPIDVPIILSRENTLTWSLRLIPSTPLPSTRYIDHTHNQSVHPTVSEYLTIQAIRLTANKTLLDATPDGWTWLNGKCTDNGILPPSQSSPAGTWSPDTGWVGIVPFDPSERITGLSVREPEWK